MKKKVAINGFGRIGRGCFKNIINKYSEQIEIVAINDLQSTDDVAHLLRFDSVYGRLPYDVEVFENTLRVNGQTTRLYAERDPHNLPWGELDVDVVVECTGLFTNYENASKHLSAGAKKVIISAPSKDPDKIPSFVMGVNEKEYHPDEHHIVDMGSCTTNCLAPVAKIINDHYQIITGLMTTVHSYTLSQNVLDGPHKDRRRSRAAALNIIPTSTGAAKAVGRVIPELTGKINGIAMRVPTPTVSVVDFVCSVEKETSRDELLSLLEQCSQREELKNILYVEKNQLVSSDFIGSPFSSIVDSDMVDVKGNLIKIISWYDNEWGYSSRLADFTNYV